MKILIVSILIFLINLPFGYWRGNVKKFSLQWVLAIHIPVPIIIALRIYSDIGFTWYSYVFLLSAFFIGQKIGDVLHSWHLQRYDNTSSCLTIDFSRLIMQWIK